jgi:HrpA-like RNA helicase
VTIHHVAKPLTSDTARLEAALELAMRVHTQRPAGPNQDVLLFLAGQDDIATATHAARALAAELRAAKPELPELLVLPLHSSVASTEQARVLALPQPGTRRLIVATNIAETSLTIPGVSCVIDPGVAKEKRYERDKGMEVLSVIPISQSSAIQRKGRAGRDTVSLIYNLFPASSPLPPHPSPHRYERDKGMEVLSVIPISQSSAIQRAGRAGRTAPGEVWRLYTEEQLAGFSLAPVGSRAKPQGTSRRRRRGKGWKTHTHTRTHAQTERGSERSLTLPRCFKNAIVFKEQGGGRGSGRPHGAGQGLATVYGRATSGILACAGE